MNKETRKEIKKTFESLGKMVSQTSSAEVLVKSTPGFDELLARAKAYSHSLDMAGVEKRNDYDICFDIVKAIEAIEICQSEVKGGRNGDEWLNTARERIGGVNNRLKDWVD